MAKKNANALSKKAEQEAAKKLAGSKTVPKLKGQGTVSGTSTEQRRKAKES